MQKWTASEKPSHVAYMACEKAFSIVDDKVQGFQTTVSRRIHEIDHADIFLLDK